MQQTPAAVLVVALSVLSSSGSAAAQVLDPARGEVPLPAAAGWTARLAYETDCGIWTVKALQVRPELGCPEIVAMDDRGRLTVLVSYSGKWTPYHAVHDGQWLAPVARVDLDPSVEGAELYTGGKAGNLYQVRVAEKGELRWREVAHFPGEEIHTLVGGALEGPGSPERLLVFLLSGEVHEVCPESAAAGFAVHRLGRLPGRVRDAVVLRDKDGQVPWIATVSRAQEVALVRAGPAGLERRVVLREPMGFGRIALAALRPGRRPVLYVTRDDGLVLRLPWREDGTFGREIVYAGPQGPRGLVAGRFDADPEVETVAVFGYSADVVLLRRPPGGTWQAERIFTDRDKGHWLAAAELDGRNATTELIGSGYGGRVFVLSRPPGYGLPGVPTEAGRQQKPRAGPRPLRVAVVAGGIAERELSPLRYRGGFETKTAVYETLVRRDASGRIVPGLAESWRFENGGSTVVLRLRERATFHDGQPVSAAAVALHFRRWVGLPEHAWLRSSARIRRIEAIAEREVRVEMDRPWALLPDLCAINPTAVQAPGALDREGSFVRPVGSGPFAVLGTEMGVLHLARWQPASAPAARGERLDLLRLDKDPAPDPLAALRSGEVDAVFSSWLCRLPAQEVIALRADPRFAVRDGPGSAVRFLSFRLGGGPAARLAVRRAVAAAIDRAALVAELESGLADPCTALCAPSVKIWPPGRPPASAPPVELEQPLRLIVNAGRQEFVRLGRAVAEQLRRAGLPVTVLAMEAGDYAAALQQGEYDLRIETTWGVPYDPYLSLVTRFAPPPPVATAASERAFDLPEELASLVQEAMQQPRLEDRCQTYQRIQELLDRQVLVVPLYAPRQVSAVRAGLPCPRPTHDLYRAPWPELLAQ